MIDLHTHSAISDGTDSIEELIDAAVRVGITVLGLSDHDTMDGIEDAQALGRTAGIEVLRGMELSTHLDLDSEEISVHLLAYGCSPQNEVLTALMKKLCAARESRIPAMLARLADMGMPLTIAEVEAQSSSASSLGRPHIADAMVVRGYVVNRDQAFTKYLDASGPAYVRRYTPSVSEALAIVNASGGVGVIAHPWGRGNREAMTKEVIQDLTRNHGLYGIEADHVDHSDEDRQILHGIAHDLDLVATGSSDYHGLGKTRNPLGIHQTSRSTYEAIRSSIIERGGRP